MNRTTQIIISVLVIILVVAGLYVFLNPKAQKNDVPDVSKIPVTESAKDQNSTSSPKDGQATSTPSQPTNVSTSTPKTMTTQDGLQITILKEGSGAEAKPGDLVTVHYLGTLTNGTKFDASYDRGQPFKFQLGTGMVIAGWDEGVAGMKVGEKRKLVIPADLAYGDRDMGVIPPNSTLVFEVEMVKIN